MIDLKKIIAEDPVTGVAKVVVGLKLEDERFGFVEPCVCRQGEKL